MIAAARAAGATAPHRLVPACAVYAHARSLCGFRERAERCGRGIVLAPVYGDREDPIEGVSSHLIANEITGSVLVAESLESAAHAVASLAEDGDTILTVGSGTVTRSPDWILANSVRDEHPDPASELPPMATRRRRGLETASEWLSLRTSLLNRSVGQKRRSPTRQSPRFPRSRLCLSATSPRLCRPLPSAQTSAPPSAVRQHADGGPSCGVVALATSRSSRSLRGWCCCHQFSRWIRPKCRSLVTARLWSQPTCAPPSIRQDGQSLATLSMSHLAAELKDIPGVREAHVVRHWPNGLVVTLVSREPAAALPDPTGGFTLVDDEGDSGWPRVEGAKGTADALGSNDKPKVLAAALAVMSRVAC